MPSDLLVSERKHKITHLHICQRTRLAKLFGRTFKCLECGGRWLKHTWANGGKSHFTALSGHPMPNPYLH